jgi:hypothetical protein
MPSDAEIKVHGLAELQRTFARIDKNLSKEVRKELREVAVPVRDDAAARAAREIRNITPPWARMRIGVTRHSVYVAPVERGRRSELRRPNLAGLLMDRAMQPALDAHEDDIEHALGEMLDNLMEKHG